MHYKLKLKEDTEGERMAKLKQQQQEAVGALPHRDFDERSEEHKFEEDDEYNFD